MKKLKILVLAGGSSTERVVSLNSARAICGGLQRLGHSITALDTADGRTLLDAQGAFLSVDDSSSPTGETFPTPAAPLWLTRADLREIDLVFLALHGGVGEDGTLQTLLSLTGKCFTGSDRVASAVCMSKPLAKRIAESLGFPTASWLDIRKSGASDGEVRRKIDTRLAEIGFPVIVKPADGGSTIGLSVVNATEGIDSALAEAFATSDHILIEKYIKGRELTVAVFDGEVWPVVEITPKGGLYDFNAKYTKGGSEYQCPAHLSIDVTERVQKYARDIYTACGCQGLARVDFMLAEDETPYFLEVNTLPGMTELSLAPMSASVAGHSFDALLQKMIESALARGR